MKVPVQKFLVATTLHGFHLNWETVLFLAEKIPERKKELIDKATYVFENDASELVKYITYCTYEFRSLLIPFIEKLNGDFSELDNINDGHLLRIVEVPYGHDCQISSDSETGYEYVEECHETWHAPQDDDLKCRIALEKMLVGYKYDKEHSFIESEDKSIQCVFTEKYGLAKTPIGYCPLKQYTYVAWPRAKDNVATKYEPMLNHVNSSLVHYVVLPTIPADEFVAYVELYRKLAGSVSENTSRTEIGLFHPQRAAADSAMEEP